MIAAIHCLDDPARPGLRSKHYPEHLAYLDNAQDVHIVLCGPLLADDGETRIGSLLVVEAEDMDAVEAFSNNGPFRRNGVWGQVAIRQQIIAKFNPPLSK